MVSYDTEKHAITGRSACP